MDDTIDFERERALLHVNQFESARGVRGGANTDDFGRFKNRDRGRSAA
jgi:hypothetical protein